MKDLIAELEKLKKTLHERFASVAESSTLDAFVSLLADYQHKVMQRIGDETKRIEGYREENELLRSISGVGETDVRAKVLELSAELQFLRQQLIDQKTVCEDRQQKIQNLLKTLEETGNAVHAKQYELQKTREKFEAEFNALKSQQQKVEQELTEERTKTETHRKQLHEQHSRYQSEMYRKMNAEVTAVANKVRDFCGVVAGSATYCLEKWGENKSKLAKYFESKLKIKLPVLISKRRNPLEEISADLDLIQKFSTEAVQTLDRYTDLLKEQQPVKEKVYWQAIIDALKRKYFDVLVSKRVKIVWPAEKQYPQFISDASRIQRICEILIDNAVEAVPRDGMVTVSGTFSPEKTIVSIISHTVTIESDVAEKMFLPYFTTKPNHRGLGLCTADKLLISLEGSIMYRCAPGETLFTITIPGHEA